MRVDQNAIRFNQASLITLTLLAYLLNAPLLVGFVAVVLALGTIIPSLALFKQIYRHVVVPVGLLTPNVVPDDPTPHRFAQGVGATFLGLSTILLFAHAPLVGWGLAGLVVILAGINLFLGFCAGCFIYYQLVRFGLIRRQQQHS